MKGALLAAIAGLSAAIYGLGLTQNLPYAPETDEADYVQAAQRVAASGDLNPRWFGHPGSTVVYPLAAAIALSESSAEKSRDFSADDPTSYSLSQASDYWFGRLLGAFYASLLSVLIFRLGREAFDDWTGLAAALLMLTPLEWVEHVQVVRTDTASTFLGALALLLTLRSHASGSRRDQLLAAAAAGICVSTKYYMALLLPLLGVVDLLAARRRGESAPARLALTGAAALAAFAATTPYFFLDLPGALASLRHESRASHLSADGLGTLGNLAWYLRKTPQSLGWPLALLAAAGAAMIARRGTASQRLLLAFALIFLAGISLHPLHWRRWLFQITPLLLLFAAHALRAAAPARPAALAALTLALAAPGLLRAARVSAADAGTRVLAREWIAAHVPAGEAIAQDPPGAALNGAPYRVEQGRLPLARRPLEHYRREGVGLLVINHEFLERFRREPARYARELAFYAELEKKAERLAEFAPAGRQRSPLSVYRLR